MNNNTAPKVLEKIEESLNEGIEDFVMEYCKDCELPLRVRKKLPAVLMIYIKDHIEDLLESNEENK